MVLGFYYYIFNIYILAAFKSLHSLQGNGKLQKTTEFRDKRHEHYIEVLNPWTLITELEKAKQAITVALFCPENNSHFVVKLFAK